MASERIANSNPNIPGTSISCNNTTTLKFTRRPSKENAKNDILISEKSAKIKQWVIQRLQDLEDQNERLKQQNLRCTNQLKALTSYAERNKHWHNSSLFSQSVTGTLPSWRDFMEQNRTSDDSGLTSDDTSADRKPLKFSTADESIPYSTIESFQTVMMTQSTSALLKRSPRMRNKTPNGRTNVQNQVEVQDPVLPLSQAPENAHSSTSDSSPWDEKPKPIPTPRKSKVQSTQSDQHVVEIPMRSNHHHVSGVERDSLNSYDVEDDYGEYEEDEDEIFEEIDYGDSPVQETLNVSPNKKDIRFADYVNLNDFVVVKDGETSSRLSQVYSDINKNQPEPEVPELPKHKPFMQWEQRLYRNAEKCLSVVESACNSPTPNKQSDPIVIGRSELALPLLANAQMNGTLRRVNVTNLTKNGPTDFSKHLCAREHSFGSMPSGESDSGFGRGSNGSGRGSGLAAVPESSTTPPEGMVLTHPPNGSHNSTGSHSFLTASSVNFGASTSRGSGASSGTGSMNQHNNSIASSSNNCSFNGGDSTYAIPPDAKFSAKMLKGPPTIRASLVPTTEMVEKSGHLVELSENKFRSFKRRYVTLKNGKLCFYKKKNDDEPSKTIVLTGIKSIARVTTKSGVHGFQINTETERLKYQAECDKATEDWYTALNQSLKNLTIAEISQRTRPVDSTLKGWITKVKRGHQKRYFASLMGQKLLFFKKEEDKIPCSHLFLQGAKICEKSKGSSDEYSDSSEDQNIDGSFNDSSSASNGYHGSPDYSICIEIPNVDPLYIMLRSSEEKDKWLYYLKMASRDAAMGGTPFEMLVQKLMLEFDPMGSSLWEDPLLSICDENNPVDSLTSIEDDELKRKALELDLACFLFTSVLMKPIAVQYHVDLSQNILSSLLESDELKNELYAQLIRLTNNSMPYAIQAWKLLALAIPIYLPKQYSILWLLKQHLARQSKSQNTAKEYAKMASFCEQLIQKRQKVGDRREGPSKLEAISILTRDPSNTKLPFSVPILLPSGDYQVVEFDGSTEIGQCLSSLCLKLSLRPALLSGYALYANDPSGGEGDLILLKGKQKICDCLSTWERQIKDSRMGRVTTDSCSIKLQLRMRHYWNHLSDEETQMEKVFLCYRMADEIVAGHLPMSNELAEELCALYAQMCYGDSPPSSNDPQFDIILSKFYPAKMLEVVNHRSLKETVCQNWSQLNGLSLTECVRMILAVLRKWKFFGAYIKMARMKMPSDRKIFIALTDEGIHLLTDKQLDVIRSFPYHRLVNFGEYRDDFMITVSRILPPDAHPEETPRERLTFYMEKKHIEQLTCHLAEYIRCQKLVWKLSMK